MDVLGGRFFNNKFCERHAGTSKICTHSGECAIRVLWIAIQGTLDGVLRKISLMDLLSNEQEMAQLLDPSGALLPLLRDTEQRIIGQPIA
jgi:hypothetical protein